MLVFIIIIVLIIILIIKAINMPQQTEIKEEPNKYQQHEFTPAEKEALRQADEVMDINTYYAIKDGTYTGPLPEYDLGFWSDLYPNIYRTKIAGINFRKDAKSYIGQIVDAMLYPDPKNEYDSKAIKIVTTDYTHIGFIPADETDAVREFVNNHLPYKCKARIIERTEDDIYSGSRTYLDGIVHINKPQSTTRQ